MGIFVIVLAYGIGIFLIAKPKQAWKISNWWYVEEGTPTKTAIIYIRIGGVIVLLHAIFFTLAYFLW